MRFGWARTLIVRTYLSVLMLVGLAVGLFPFAAANAGSIRAVQVSGDKVIVRFDGSVTGASAFLLDTPRRIALDIHGAAPGSGGIAQGAIAAIRQGQFTPTTARIVFDLARPTIISDGQFPPDGQDRKSTRLNSSH